MSKTAAANYGDLCDAETNDVIRPATRREAIESAEAGYEGGIEVDGRTVYVCGDLREYHGMSDEGTVTIRRAVDFDHAIAKLDKSIPDHCIADGAWAWIENPEDGDRYVIGEVP